jgi:hypothetical protein
MFPYPQTVNALLKRFPTAWGSEPQSVHDELADLRSQVEAQLRQPGFL